MRARYRLSLVAGAVAAGLLAVGGGAAGGSSASSATCVWKSFAAPLPSFPQLPPGATSVAAVSSRDAWATARWTNPLDKERSTTFLRWNGSRWRVVRAPAEPTAVAVRGHDVWAVGRRNGRPVALHWAANRWTVSSLPAGAGSKLDSVTIDSAGDTWAVGESADGSVLVLHRNGAGWSRVAAPEGAYAATAVAAIPGSAGVWLETSDLGEAPVDADRWTGSAWEINSLDVPGAEWSLGGQTLAASSATDAWVGLTIIDGANHDHPWLLHWDGTSWTATPPPNPGGNAQLNGISARSATDAWAVGTYVATHRRLISFVLHWDGTGWSRVRAPAHVQRQHGGGAGGGSNAIAVVPGSNQVWVAGGTLDRGRCG